MESLQPSVPLKRRGVVDCQGRSVLQVVSQHVGLAEKFGWQARPGAPEIR